MLRSARTTRRRFVRGRNFSDNDWVANFGARAAYTFLEDITITPFASFDASVGVDRKAPLSELYDQATIRRIVSGLETANRWGVKEGQLSLASKMINTQAINRVVRQYIDDEISAADAVAKLNAELGAVK